MNKPKIIYIAGPLNGDVDAHVSEAERVAFELAKRRVMFYCPHYNAQKHFALKLPESYWIAMGLEVLRRCDAVLLLEGWGKSSGTLGEIDEAESCNIPIYPPSCFEECVRLALGFEV